MLRECLTMALPTALIQSSFSLSVSATKNMLVSAVDISKAKGLFMVSSAPLMERQPWMSMTPRGSDPYNIDEVAVLHKKLSYEWGSLKRKGETYWTDNIAFEPKDLAIFEDEPSSSPGF